MSEYDDEPELAGYVPHDSARPLRSRRTVLAMRAIVIIGLLGFVLPAIATIVSVGKANAQESCRRWVAYEVPGSPGYEARFEVLGPSFIGWECYTSGAFGGDRLIASLGLIPGVPAIPRGTVGSS
jgi:hypothetical protein